MSSLRNFDAMSLNRLNQRLKHMVEDPIMVLRPSNEITGVQGRTIHPSAGVSSEVMRRISEARKAKDMNAKSLAGSKGTSSGSHLPCQRSHKPLPLPKERALLPTALKNRPQALKLATDGCAALAPVEYQDSWLDCVAINHLTRTLQAVTGKESKKQGYAGLLEAARFMARSLGPEQQQELVSHALQRAVPGPILAMMRAVLPNSKFAREVSAAFTTFFFAWLVGPCEVRESETHGRREKNLVFVKKCRFLEGSNCAGMCINLCKFPTQKFIKDSLGMPITLVPNFEDMSCKMVFGEEPPSPHQDPASSQPCYKLCEINKRHNRQKCSI